MSQAPLMGLVAAGSGVRPFLARVPSLLGRLGPVKGVSFPSARKLVVSMRSGYAIPTYAALEGCPLIWIAVPDPVLDGVLAELAGQAWAARSAFVICETARESATAHLLHARGAKLSTLNLVGESRSAVVVAEGHAEPLRILRQMCARDGRTMIRIRSGAKQRLFAGVHLATVLLKPWLTTAIHCLQSAGFTRAEAASMTLALAARAVRTHIAAGVSPLSEPQREELEQALLSAESHGEADSHWVEVYTAGLRRTLKHAAKPRRKRAAAEGMPQRKRAAPAG